jgi:hypothetical protein
METYILVVLSERKHSSIPIVIDTMIIGHFMQGNIEYLKKAKRIEG